MMILATTAVFSTVMLGCYGKVDIKKASKFDMEEAKDVPMRVVTYWVPHAALFKLGYIGCYTDDSQNDLEIDKGRIKDGDTREECWLKCKDYRFFAVQDKNYCYCGDNYKTAKRYYKVADKECKRGRNGEYGGHFKNEIYSNLHITRSKQGRRMDTSGNVANSDPVCQHIVDFVSTSSEMGALLVNMSTGHPGASNLPDIEAAADLITDSCKAEVESGSFQLVQCNLYVGLAKALAPEHLVASWLSMYGAPSEAEEACGNVVREVNRQLRGGSALPNVDVVTYGTIDGLHVQDCTLLDEATCTLLEDFRVCKWSSVAGACQADGGAAAPLASGLQIYRSWMTGVVTALGATAAAAAAVLASLCKNYDHLLPAPL